MAAALCAGPAIMPVKAIWAITRTTSRAMDGQRACPGDSVELTAGADVGDAVALERGTDERPPGRPSRDPHEQDDCKYAGGALPVPPPPFGRGPAAAATEADQARNISDRLYGAVFGCALGDAVGLPCLNGTARILADRYRASKPVYPYEISHRGYASNAWTANMDMAILAIRAVTATERGIALQNVPTVPLGQALAAEILSWKHSGFRELGDSAGQNCDPLTHRVACHDSFRADPSRAAREAFGPKTGSGALIRVLAAIAHPSAETVAGQLCAATHMDPRCIASCIFLALLVRLLATGWPVTAELVAHPAGRAMAFLPGGDQQRDMLDRLTRSVTLGSLELDSRDNQTHTFKALSAGMWAYRQLLRAVSGRHGRPEKPQALFRRVIQTIALQGGAANINASMAGMIVGAVMGYSLLPTDWIQAMPNHAWLRGECSKLFVALGSEEAQQ